MTPSLTSPPHNAKLNIRWNKLKESEVNDIDNTVDIHLHDFSSLPISDCHRTGCRDSEHLKMIDEFYKNLINTSQSSSHST